MGKGHGQAGCRDAFANGLADAENQRTDPCRRGQWFGNLGVAVIKEPQQQFLFFARNIAQRHTCVQDQGSCIPILTASGTEYPCGIGGFDVWCGAQRCTCPRLGAGQKRNVEPAAEQLRCVGVRRLNQRLGLRNRAQIQQLVHAGLKQRAFGMRIERGVRLGQQQHRQQFAHRWKCIECFCADQRDQNLFAAVAPKAKGQAGHGLRQDTDSVR